jgi:hypothetical protein
MLSDGVGNERRAARLPRVNHGIRRVVVIGTDGTVSLAALRWLADQNAAFVMLDRDGSVLLTTGPVAATDSNLRRAQACADHPDVAPTIVRELIRLKLMAQEELVRSRFSDTETADVIAGAPVHNLPTRRPFGLSATSNRKGPSLIGPHGAMWM